MLLLFLYQPRPKTNGTPYRGDPFVKHRSPVSNRKRKSPYDRNKFDSQFSNKVQSPYGSSQTSSPIDSLNSSKGRTGSPDSLDSYRSSDWIQFQIDLVSSYQ